MTEAVEDTTHPLEREDEVALADRMRAGRKSIIKEVRKLIVGQDEDTAGATHPPQVTKAESPSVGVPFHRRPGGGNHADVCPS